MEFDYVIVGAGSAGCAVANRLSANPNNRVALIEAGGKDYNPWIHIPVGYFKTMGNPVTDWCYHTEADAGLNGRSIPWPRGKVLGGSSSINGLLYVRGQAQDYQDWAALGNEGWGWDEIAPLFKRMECWWGEAENDLRGYDGLLSVEPSRYKSPIVDLWLEAAQKLGYPYTPDYNGKDQEGVNYFQLTSHKGLRCSSAVAYLRPARKRNNLKILTNIQVESLLFDQKRAVGVQARKGNQPIKIKANAEVILCAGALSSPHLLMLSGIGDGDQLQKVGLEVRHHLAGVGRNLQDHLQARPIFKCDLPTINSQLTSPFQKIKIALEYLLKRTGPMTMAASLGTGFLKTSFSKDRPDIQFHIQPFSADSPAAGPHRFSAFTASVLQLRPKSTGHLALHSSHSNDPVRIHPNYLSERLDQQVLVEGIKIARKIARQAPLNAHIIEEYSPNEDLEDEEALLNWARDHSTTIYHPTGTCKMGKDAMGVVDPQLRVHGVSGLRVADASIMPIITSGNTNAPTIMIGEKVSDMIMMGS